jgi:hypothetical protein
MAAPVQLMPPYRCWVCGKPVKGIIPYALAMGGPTVLDRYADYIGYLDLDRTCREQGHPSRVARLGPAITPLDFPAGATLEQKFQAIREALELLVVQSAREETLVDKIANVIYLTYAGAMPPDEALRQICELTGIHPVPLPNLEIPVALEVAR